MKRRAFTLAEVAVSATLLLLMVGLASWGVVFYLRSYHRYSDQALALKQQAKTLEAVCSQLRTCQRISSPIPDKLSQAPLKFLTHDGEAATLWLNQNALWTEIGTSKTKLGKAADLYLKKEGTVLELTIPVQNQLPLRTALGIPE